MCDHLNDLCLATLENYVMIALSVSICIDIGVHTITNSYGH